jgi:catechol 2,3-dioxygenase-like lactoylglutathione lyase family enzyme
MKLEGIHHISCITGDAPANVEFYAGTLGMRLMWWIPSSFIRSSPSGAFAWRHPAPENSRRRVLPVPAA